MRLAKILLGCVLVLAWCAVAGAAQVNEQNSGKIASGDGKARQAEVRNPSSPSKLKDPNCLSYREEKYCVQMREKRCKKRKRVCVEWDRNDRDSRNPRCLRHENKCILWENARCLKWGTRYVCEKWRENTRRAPDAGSAVNPAGR